MRDLGLVAGLLVGTARAVFWLLGTVWLGGRTMWRVLVLLLRWRTVMAQVRLCPRGHEVVLVSLWDCSCGARFEGWAFSSCPVCRQTAAYVPCSVCGLPVRNPLMP